MIPWQSFNFFLVSATLGQSYILCYIFSLDLKLWEIIDFFETKIIYFMDFKYLTGENGVFTLNSHYH